MDAKVVKGWRGVVKRNGLLFATLIGVFVGLILGFGIKPFQPNETVQAILAYPGELFMRGLTLLILPIIITSLSVGAASLNIKSNGKIVLRTFILFFLTSVFNAVLGLILATSIHPGNTSMKTELQNMTTSSFEERKNTVLDNFLDLGRSLVPNNIFTAFFEQPATIYEPFETVEGVTGYRKYVGVRKASNPLGVIVYSLSVGIVIAIIGEKANPLLNVLKAFDEVNMKTITGLMWFTPIGVCSIVCAKILEVQNMGTIMAALGLFILTVAIGILLYQFIFMQLLYFLIIRKNPFKFYLDVLPAVITGFATDSSTAAMPVTLKCLDENAKIDPRVSHFIIPIGVIVNMDGTALFVCIASVFIAQLNGIALGSSEYINVCALSVAVSIATTGAPSASLTLLFIILNAINVPTDYIGLLFAIDWFVDRMRTTNNILGDMYTAAIVEHLSRRELDRVDTSIELPDKEIHLNTNSKTTVM